MQIRVRFASQNEMPNIINRTNDMSCESQPVTLRRFQVTCRERTVSWGARVNCKTAKNRLLLESSGQIEKTDYLLLISNWCEF